MPDDTAPVVTLDDLIVQANEAKAAAELAKAKDAAVTAAGDSYNLLVIAQESALDAAHETIVAAQAELDSAQKDAITQLQEANDALLAFVKGLPAAPTV